MGEAKTTHNLRELCKLFGFSEAWVYKFEAYLGLRKWASNLSGKKSSYGPDQIRFFRKIHFLRAIQLGLPEIKRIYDLESKMIDIVRVDFCVDDEGEGDDVRHLEVYLLEGLYGGVEGVEFDFNKYKRKKEVANKLEIMRIEHKKILQGVHQRADVFFKEMGINLERLNRYTKESKA